MKLEQILEKVRVPAWLISAGLAAVLGFTSLSCNDWSASEHAQKAKAAHEKNDYATVHKEFTEIIKYAPSKPESWLGRAVASHELGNFGAAIEDLNKALELDPEYLIGLYLRAVMYLRLKNYEKAFEDVNKCIEGYTEKKSSDFLQHLAEAYNVRGVCYRHKKNLESALADYNTALTLNSNDTCARTNRSAVYMKLGKYGAALQDINCVIALKPGNYTAYTLRGQIKLLTSRYVEAMADCNLCLALDCGKIDHLTVGIFKPDAVRAIALNDRGIANLMLGKVKEAVSDFEKSFEICPKDEHSYALDNLARLKVRIDAGDEIEANEIKLGQDDEAGCLLIRTESQELGDMCTSTTGMRLKEFKRFVSRYGWENVQCREMIIRCMYLIENNPNDLDAHYKRAIAQKGLRKYKSAIDDFKKVLEIKQDYESTKTEIEECTRLLEQKNE